MPEWGFPNPATPVGSSTYYSLRVAPRALRDDLATVSAWRHLVRGIIDEVSDPAVARLKLHWWREELESTFAGRPQHPPQHPLSRALASVVARRGLPMEPFLAIVGEVEARILRREPADASNVDAACARDLGALFELLTLCHGPCDDARLRTARRLGAFCARVYLIRDSGALARRGRPSLGIVEMQRHGLSTAALTNPENRRRLPELLAPAAAAARAALSHERQGGGPMAREGTNRDMPVCIRARTRILAALLDEIERTGFDVADQRIALTPLRKLALAWREGLRP